MQHFPILSVFQNLLLSFPLRAHTSGFIPVHSLVYGPIDKAVHALAVGFCVGLYCILFRALHSYTSNGELLHILLLGFLLGLCLLSHVSPFRREPPFMLPPLL